MVSLFFRVVRVLGAYHHSNWSGDEHPLLLRVPQPSYSTPIIINLPGMVGRLGLIRSLNDQRIVVRLDQNYVGTSGRCVPDCHLWHIRLGFHISMECSGIYS